MTQTLSKLMHDDDCRFQYFEVLCSAIESFLDQVEERQPHAFNYRRANLRYAIERSLYFTFTESEQLYHFFWQAQTNELPHIMVVDNHLCQEFATHLLRSVLGQRQIRVKQNQLLQQWRDWRGDYWRSLFQPASAACSNFGADTLIYVTHPRFVRYLSSITKQLSESYVYLVVSNPELKDFLKQQALPFISRDINLTQNSFSHQSTLHHFRGLACFYDLVHEEILRLRPKRLLVVEGNAPEDEVVNQVCKQLSIPVVCLQQGWSPIIHNGFRNMSFTKMLVWGQGFATLLEPYNLQQSFVPVGNHILKQQAVETELFSKKDKAISFFLQAPNKLITQASWNQFIDLILWSAKTFDQTPIIVREHPRYKISDEFSYKIRGYKNVRFMPPDQATLDEVLGQSLISVSIYSSTILESIAVGVLPVIVNITSMPKFLPDVCAARAGVEVQSIAAAKCALSDLIEQPAALASHKLSIEVFKREYFSAVQNEAIENIVSEILSCAS